MTRLPGALQRTLARLLVTAILCWTPGGAFAGDEFSQADAAEMLTPGTIDNSIAGETTITSFVDEGGTLWHDGLDQPAGHILTFDLVGDAATHYNIVGGDFAAHLDGRVVSDAGDTIVFASPYGVFIGDTAVIDVGTLVAAGADLSNPDAPGSDPLTLTGAVENHGTILASQDVLLYGSHVLNSGEILTPGGQLLMLGGDAIFTLDARTIAEGLLDPVDVVALLAEGYVENTGWIRAADATLVGRRVSNQGAIEIENGTLMMLGGDAVYLRRFGDPVLVRLPHATQAPDDYVHAPDYAVENHGQIDAGRGRVRLAAADALGWGLRQGAVGSITGATIELVGGDRGRVELAGSVDASSPDTDDTGGRIDVTGEVIALVGARLDASGDAGGGTIHVGGEQRGGGSLQRARGVVLDAESEIRADARVDGDGGRVIVFAEDLASVRGVLSARGGIDGGDGGFVETSGLRHLELTSVPDVTAPNGAGGEWLIDPFSISIVAAGTATDCLGSGESCLNRAVEQVLAPNFDGADFDDILRTVAPATAGVAAPNQLDVDLLVRALSVGTNVTLSTEAFLRSDNNLPGANADEVADGAGDITIDAELSIPDGAVIPGTIATLTLIAARDIRVNRAITVGGSDRDITPDMELTIDLQANDQSQRNPSAAYGTDQLGGGVTIGADIRTGGGDFRASGIFVEQTAVDVETATTPNVLETDGGDVSLLAGSLDRFQFATTYTRDPSNTNPAPTTSVDPGVRIFGEIDTARPADDGRRGGNISLVANAVQVQTVQAGNDPLAVDAGVVEVTGTLRSGGGVIAIGGGATSSLSAGDVELVGAIIDSDGGDVTIEATRLDPLSNIGAFLVEFVAGGAGEGGKIDLDGTTITTSGGDLTIGNTSTQRITLDGDGTTNPTLDTTGGEFGHDGLISIVAPDSSGVDTVNTLPRYGMGTIEIGSRADTTIEAAGITIDSRTVSFGDGDVISPTRVSLTATGASNVDLDEVQDDEAGVTTTSVAGQIRIVADRDATFHRNTLLTAETVDIAVAADPTLLDDGDVPGTTRLSLLGTGGAIDSDGVRIAANDVTIAVGDGASLDDEGESDARTTEAVWEGLQLRSRDDDTLRSDRVSLRQDAALAIVDAGPMGAGELALGDVFGAATIGPDGLDITLESSDGVLTVASSAGLNDAGGDSRVVLNGGYQPMAAEGVAGNSVVFSTASPLDVSSLSISTPGDFTITQADVLDRIGTVGDLHFEAGRDTGLELGDVGGDLTVEDGSTLAAESSVSLHAGASGFGDLDLDPDPLSGATTTIRANEITLRAGAGAASQNLDSALRSQVNGADEVVYTDAAGSPFESADTRRAFSLRQDAAIDSSTHLPTLEDFGLTTGFGTGGAQRVEYSLRSDFGTIDLTTGTTDPGSTVFDATQFADTVLSLIGMQSSTPAIQVEAPDTDSGSPGFGQFNGPAVTLGGVGSFTYTQLLADAFAPADVEPVDGKRLTLRAGIDSEGILNFESNVVVRGSHIELVAGDGEGEGFGSTVVVGGAMFDLDDADDANGPRVLVFQEDEVFALSDLPNRDTQFVNGLLPTVLAVRNDSGLIDLSDPDFTGLPLDLTGMGTEGRFILEADTIILTANAGRDLELTSAPQDDGSDALANLKLRLRGNTIVLETIGGSETNAGTILLGHRDEDDAGPLGERTDSDFDDESILIEGFDANTDVATTTNLSDSAITVEATSTTPARYDPLFGRGPTTFTLRQDAEIAPDDPMTTENERELLDRYDFAGYLARGSSDDADETPIPTIYHLSSRFGDVTIDADDVSGSGLEIGDLSDLNSLRGGDVTFEGGSPFLFEDLIVFTEGSIFVGDDADITAEGTLRLEAAALFANPPIAIVAPDPTDPMDEGNVMGRLVFEGMGQTDLVANQIILRGGPTGRRTNPDTDRNGIGETIEQDALGRIEFAGLGSLAATSMPSRTTSLTVTQSADFDVSPVVLALAGPEWGSIDLAAIQGRTSASDLTTIGTMTEQLTLGRANLEASVLIDTDGAGADPLTEFEGTFRVESNDITFRRSTGPELRLDSPRLELVSSTFRTGFELPNEIGRVISDPDALDRPLVRIDQAGVDFAGTILPRMDAYFQLGILPGTYNIVAVPRNSLQRIDLQLRTTGGSFVVDDEIRNGAATSNLSIRSCASFETCDDDGVPGGGGTLSIDLATLVPGYDTYTFDAPDIGILDFPALPLSSLDIGGFDTIEIADFTPSGASELTIDTTGDQIYGGAVVLHETLAPTGRDILFADDVYRFVGMPGSMDDAPAEAGLFIRTRGEVRFEGNLGTMDGEVAMDGDPDERLGSLWVVFDSDVVTRTPSVHFGRRSDADDDGIFETADPSDQFVYVDEDIVFVTTDFGEPNDPTDDEDGNRIDLLRDAIRNASGLDDIASALDNYRAGATPNGKLDFRVGREHLSSVSTIGKGNGDLSFQTASGGHFVMGSGERLSVGGAIDIDHTGHVVTLGDVAAIGEDPDIAPTAPAGIRIDAAEIGLVRRNSGTTFLPDGSSTQDAGPAILANTIDFGDATVSGIGVGKQPRFGVRNPFDPGLPDFLDDFPVLANLPGSRRIDLSAFSFVGSDLAEFVPSLLPLGASRSDLSGAFGPRVIPVPSTIRRELPPLERPDRLRELAVEARETPDAVKLARLEGAAIIDDLGLVSSEGTVAVTDSRLDAKDAEAAINLYESLFGADGKRAEEVQRTLQAALDRYLETTRVRRVIGFELRRFVKNRPSTLLHAYSTLDQLDDLFRYHRRLGLSPGEFRKIQTQWLSAIQPEGITLDELSEAIHPSRYVRGSDILDVFGR